MSAGASFGRSLIERSGDLFFVFRNKRKWALNQFRIQGYNTGVLTCRNHRS